MKQITQLPVEKKQIPSRFIHSETTFLMTVRLFRMVLECVFQKSPTTYLPQMEFQPVY